MGEPARIQPSRTWSIWDLDEEERETVLFLRRVMRANGNDCAFTNQIDQAINDVRAQIDDQRARYQAWLDRSWWQRLWQRNLEPPMNPDAFPQPLVATADGWVQFMLAIERLRVRGILWEKRLYGTGGLDYMYKLFD